jgi:hypothetical protein
MQRIETTHELKESFRLMPTPLLLRSLAGSRFMADDPAAHPIWASRAALAVQEIGRRRKEICTPSNAMRALAGASDRRNRPQR